TTHGFTVGAGPGQNNLEPAAGPVAELVYFMIVALRVDRLEPRQLLGPVRLREGIGVAVPGAWRDQPVLTVGRSEASAIEPGWTKVFITLHGASFNATSYHLVRRRGKGGPLPFVIP